MATAERIDQQWSLVAVSLSMLVTQMGSAMATVVIHEAGPAGVAMSRLGVAAIVTLAICRPSWRDRCDWPVTVRYGVALAVMNTAFYVAVSRIPLGVAVTIELAGPLAVSATTRRGPGRIPATLVALVGVVLIVGVGAADDAVGIGAALVAAGAWASYIHAGRSVGSSGAPFEHFALAMAVGAVVVAPVGLGGAASLLEDPRLLLVAGLVAVASSIVPYSLELVALRRLSAADFGSAMSLSPVVATVVGWVILHEPIHAPSVVGMALTVAAATVLLSR